MALSVDEILGLYETRGARMYGPEPVSQAEHALQCAMLAAQGGASAELIAAAFLHDVGHLIAELPHTLERESLSPASKHSLELQGGIFDALAADRFLSRPFAWDAIRLRRWDDSAKTAGRAMPGLRDFEPVLRSLERTQSPNVSHRTDQGPQRRQAM